jgi:hypothetical protein
MKIRRFQGIVGKRRRLALLFSLFFLCAEIWELLGCRISGMLLFYYMVIESSLI